MKLASFWAAGRDRIGFEDADGNVVDIAAAAASMGSARWPARANVVRVGKLMGIA